MAGRAALVAARARKARSDRDRQRRDRWPARRFGHRAAHGVEPAAAAVRDGAEGPAQVSVRLHRADDEQGLRLAAARREDRREPARRGPFARPAQGARRRRDRAHRVDADSVGPFLDVGRRQLRQRDPDALRRRVPRGRARRRLQRARRHAAESAEAAQRRSPLRRPSVLRLRAQPITCASPTKRIRATCSPA